MKIGERFRGAEIVELLKVQVLEGDGTADSIASIVVYFVDPVTSKVICRIDPFADDESAPVAAGEQG